MSVHEKSDASSSSPGPIPTTEPKYPSTAKVLTLLISCLSAMFLVSLDRTIISTAIPYITDQFHSIDDIGWYGSAYTLTNSAFQLLYGKLYKSHSTRAIFLVAILLFEIGSAVCGAAPSSNALIIGRAIAGAGSAGVMAGSMQVLVLVVPLQKRPVYAGLFSSTAGVASVISPLISGAFTERVSWRWCFYINLPFAALTIVVILLLLDVPRPPSSGGWKERVAELDLLGVLIFIPCMTCLVLALQWGGSYGWSDGRVIALWAVFGVTLIAWLAVQWWKGENATVPGRIFCQRSIWAGFIFCCTFVSAMMILVYYIPIWFQAIKGDSPVMAGVSFIPFLVALIIAAVLGGLFTSKIGYYVPTMYLASIIASIGVGLTASSFKVNTGHPRWIGLQVLSGFGIGLGMQQTFLAAQTVLSGPDVSIGMAIMFFGQQLGGTVFLQVAETVFGRQLASNLRNVPGLSGTEQSAINSAGATKFRGLVPSAMLPSVLTAYNGAIARTWYIALGLACVSIIPVLLMEWVSIKPKGEKAQEREEGPDNSPRAGEA